MEKPMFSDSLSNASFPPDQLQSISWKSARISAYKAGLYKAFLTQLDSVNFRNCFFEMLGMEGWEESKPQVCSV